MFGEATDEERKRYYLEEWRKEALPAFIQDRMGEREFAFDERGEGPNNRYNAFSTAEQLSQYVGRSYPYAIYTSVSFYDFPQRREGWRGSELVFDVDARDQPVRRCNCAEGEVCEKCLEDAKEIAVNVMQTLEEDLGLGDVYLIYSGRGYHVRVFDNVIMGIAERGPIFDYVVADKVPPDIFMQRGYASVFRRMFMLTFAKMKKDHIKMRGAFVEKKEEIIEKLSERDRVGLERIRRLPIDTLKTFFEEVAKINAGIVDGKVTVDLKRILRLPSSLHSKVSMICCVVGNPDTFDPLNDAVPLFVRERGA
jgi:DNA primase small subunit